MNSLEPLLIIVVAFSIALMRMILLGSSDSLKKKVLWAGGFAFIAMLVFVIAQIV